MGQPVQIAGAVALLIAFVLAQMGVLTQRSGWYLGLNLIGSAVLAVDAYLGRQWGFFLLEGVWAIVSAWGLVERRRRSTGG
jgi:membrane-bound ClpP family serine protease